MKLKYWYAECLDDARCYSIIAKTKKGAKAQIESESLHAGRFGPIHQREIEFTDSFDLFKWATSEGGGRDCGDVI